MDSLWKHKLQSKQIRVKTDSSTLPPPQTSPALHHSISQAPCPFLSPPLSPFVPLVVSHPRCAFVTATFQVTISFLSVWSVDSLQDTKRGFFALVLEKKSTRVCSLVALESQNWIQLTCKCLLIHNQGYHVEYWGAVILLSSAKPSH